MRRIWTVKNRRGKIYKNVDQLEFLLQACAYGCDAIYFQKSLNNINCPYCKEITLSAIDATKGNKKTENCRLI